ncbi:MAG: hypothetical protein FWH34_07275 [Desulfovibrionaceae bacterium]|nr:hypothetical protein [Desulfovibrionaceae bacterium]
MTTLESLRKEYDKLNPFERAVMRAEAAARCDEAAIDALQAPSLWDAFHSAMYGGHFMGIAFWAVSRSQALDTVYWASMAILLALESGEKAKGKADQENDAKLDEHVRLMNEGRRGRVAWLLALQALDDELGVPCMTTARAVAGCHIDAVFSDKEAANVDFSAELERLRQMWTTVSEYCHDAPRAKGAAATGSRQ